MILIDPYKEETESLAIVGKGTENYIDHFKMINGTYNKFLKMPNPDGSANPVSIPGWIFGKKARPNVSKFVDDVKNNRFIPVPSDVDQNKPIVKKYTKRAKNPSQTILSSPSPVNQVSYTVPPVQSLPVTSNIPNTSNIPSVASAAFNTSNTLNVANNSSIANSVTNAISNSKKMNEERPSVNSMGMPDIPDPTKQRLIYNLDKPKVDDQVVIQFKDETVLATVIKANPKNNRVDRILVCDNSSTEDDPKYYRISVVSGKWQVLDTDSENKHTVTFNFV